MSLRRRTVLTLAVALAASVLPILPVTIAAAAPVAPKAVLLPAPAVTPTSIAAGTAATVHGARCVPTTSTRVYVTLTDTGGRYVTSDSVVPASDGMWTLSLTPAITTTPGSYLVSATCDRYGSQAAYRSRPVTVTASTAAPWTGQTPALPNVPNGALNDVSCVTAPALVPTPDVAGCVAVGYSDNPGHALVEVWDGSSWSVVPLSAPTGNGGVYLFSVDCTATTRCVAVGDIGTDSGHRAFVAQLSGTTWTTSVLPPPTGQNEGSLSSVSCPTSTICYALGSTGSLSEGSRYSAVAYRLRGTTWSQVADPVASSPRYGLGALSCVDAKTCVAVGSDSYNYPNRPLAQVFDGTLWHSMVLAAVPLSSSPSLSDIECSTNSSCVAVGSTVDNAGASRPLVETLTNSTWRVSPVSSVDPSLTGALRSVSCLGARFCTAVGATVPYQSNGQQPVAATFANGAWTLAGAGPDSSTGSEYAGVSCAGSLVCVAVGDAGNVPLAAATTTRGWADMGAAAPAGYVGGQFDAVACSAVDACTAGGFSYQPDRIATTPLVNRWNGRTWSLQALPDVGRGRITGVACPSATFCVAVGWIDVDNATIDRQPLLLQKRGATWKATPVTTRDGAALNAVSCSSATSCLAVGVGGPFNDSVYAVALSGTAWKATPKPRLTHIGNPSFSAVSCVTGAGCRVLGSGYDTQNFQTRGIDVVWDGTGYTVGPEGPDARAVSCTSATACVAVGDTSGGSTAASVFDGTAWTPEPLPAPTGSYAQVFGVACRDALSCVAVGSADGAFIARRATDGSWSAEPVATGYSTLRAVACPTGSRCVSVGDTDGRPTIAVSPAG